MVKKSPKLLRAAITAMGIALIASSFANASESGILSARAQRSINSGKFAKGYGQLERALLASRKEADLHSEARVLIGMAQVRTISLDLDLADTLLSVVNKDALDISSQVQLVTAKAAIANARSDFKKAAGICNSINEKILENSSDEVQTAFYGECAIASAGINRTDDARTALKMVGKRSSKKSGFYAFTAARIADFTNDGDADSLYRIAEEKSIKANKPYLTADILYLRSKLRTTSEEAAKELRRRCKNAFELMGLPNNAKRCTD